MDQTNFRDKTTQSKIKSLHIPTDISRFQPMKRLSILLLLTVFFAVNSLQPSALLAQDSSKSGSQNWYKGNLHTHSLWSDGNDFPEMICKWYKDRGYHFLGLSDHNILSVGQKWMDVEVVKRRGSKTGFERYQKVFGGDWVETRMKDNKTEVRLKPLNEFKALFDEPEKFLMIQAEEITDHFGRLPIHINATNLQDLIKPQGGTSVRDTISNNLKAIKRQQERVGRPIFAHLNHPNFGWAVSAEDLAAVVEEKFFEVYNGHPSVNQLGDAKRPSLEKMWDIANTIRIGKMKLPPLHGIATDDSHNYFGTTGSSPGRGWVMVKAAKLTPSKLINALEAGDFYASSGVEVNSFAHNDSAKTFSVSIKAAKGVTYKTQFIGTKKDVDVSELKSVGVVLKESNELNPSYKLTGDELYVRVVITSSSSHPNPSLKGQKQQAWLQPMWR